MSVIDPEEVSTAGEHRWMRLANWQGYYGASARRLARRADALYPHGLEMNAACEVITNLAHELDLPMPEKI